MNPSLRNKIASAIGGGAIAIATVMLRGNGGLEGREYAPYKDVVGIITVCDGHTGNDIILNKRYSDAECDALTKADLERIAKQVNPSIKVKTTETQLAAIYSFPTTLVPTPSSSPQCLKSSTPVTMPEHVMSSSDGYMPVARSGKA